MTSAKLALVTGGSTGIGRHLAQLAAEDGHDLLIASDDAAIADMEALTATGVTVETVMADLSREAGMDELLARLGARVPDLFFANAGRGLGQAMVDQQADDIRHLIGTNIMGTTLLTHEIARRMVRRGAGRILMTGSIAGYMLGTYQAVYNASKAYVNMLAVALRHELQDSGVSVTCLSPGPTDTEFFGRAGLLDTPIGQGPKDDPAVVAKAGYQAMMARKEEIVPGLKNKSMVAASHVTPKSVLAEQHRKMAKPQDPA
ncbi:SDR family NAD(P)-dependent oxidoreductase [Paracoccus sp. T5]|uniref:SDR family NAD(P)-dependent oxidoreductase n=1 Tax=Paracoccus sp. T5 TaxID=3402161 RepID=UPI003AECEB6E